MRPSVGPSQNLIDPLQAVIFTLTSRLRWRNISPKGTEIAVSMRILSIFRTFCFTDSRRLLLFVRIQHAIKIAKERIQL